MPARPSRGYESKSAPPDSLSVRDVRLTRMGAHAPVHKRPLAVRFIVGSRTVKTSLPRGNTSPYEGTRTCYKGSEQFAPLTVECLRSRAVPELQPARSCSATAGRPRMRSRTHSRRSSRPANRVPTGWSSTCTGAPTACSSSTTTPRSTASASSPSTTRADPRRAARAPDPRRGVRRMRGHARERRGEVLAARRGRRPRRTGAARAVVDLVRDRDLYDSVVVSSFYLPRSTGSTSSTRGSRPATSSSVDPLRSPRSDRARARPPRVAPALRRARARRRAGDASAAPRARAAGERVDRRTIRTRSSASPRRASTSIITNVPDREAPRSVA